MSKENKMISGQQNSTNNGGKTSGTGRKPNTRFGTSFKGETAEMNGKVFQLLS